MSENADFSLLSREQLGLKQPLGESDILEAFKNPESPIYKTAIFLGIQAVEVQVFIHVMIAKSELEIEKHIERTEKQEQSIEAREYQAALNQQQEGYQPKFIDPKDEAIFSKLQAERDALLEEPEADDIARISMMNWHLLQNFSQQSACLLKETHPQGLNIRAVEGLESSEKIVQLKLPDTAPEISDISQVIHMNPDLLNEDKSRLDGLAAHYANLSTGLNLSMKYLFVMLRIPENQAQLAKAGYPDPDLIPSSVLKPLLKEIDQVISNAQKIPGNHQVKDDAGQTVIGALVRNNEIILNKLQQQKQENERQQELGGNVRPPHSAN